MGQWPGRLSSRRLIVPCACPACLCLQKKDVAAKREASWKVKMERSPFHVDLVAEHERIDEVRGV